MASITEQANGRRMIQFTDANGKRRTIRLGKVAKKQADSTKTHIEQLVAAQITGHVPDDKTSKWVAGLDTTLRGRLAAVGLVEMREAHSLSDYITNYRASRTDVKYHTRNRHELTARRLTEFFGEKKPLRDITAGDADEFERWVGKGKRTNTTRKHIAVCKVFFNSAVRKELIDRNPFRHLKSTVIEARDRDYFVSRDETEKVIKACPDAQWRLLVALSRYGGLRCPSEHLRLTWGDVDWENGRLTVHSPKTEHHEGGDYRVIPIFPELLTHLESVFDEAGLGEEHIITRYRESTTNLRTQLQRIIKRAGLKSWPKLWQNMRASRQTELAETFPAHVVCEWIGNSEAVAKKHYLQVTDDHYAKALQKAPQHTAVSERTEMNSTDEEVEDTQDVQQLAELLTSVLGEKVPRRGVEPRPPDSKSGMRPSHPQGGTG